MPKKSVATRSGAQRQKPRAQKSFELVRPQVEERDDEIQLGAVPAAKERDDETQLGAVPAAQSITTVPAAPKPRESRQSGRTAKSTSTATVVTEPVVETKSEGAPKVSASTRMAARRQATQRTQQRSSATLITAEHFAYVRRDLVIIATLAVLMFAAIIVLYFAFGRGA